MRRRPSSGWDSPSNSAGRRKFGRPSHATVVAYLSLFVALGGSAYAFHLGRNTVGTRQLKKNSVVTAKVKDEAITAVKVRRGTLTGTQIDASTLGTVPTATQAKTADSANALTAPEDWHVVGAPGEPPFLNSWKRGPGSRTPAFYKDHEGLVHLRGTALEGEPFTPIFLLPPGFRPASHDSAVLATVCAPCSAGELGVLLIEGPELTGGVDGAVVAPEGASLTVSLDGISFRAES
ncbi:MAG TPA: hypothetical protein VGF09_02905 [Solirubrobacterales bacterium]|jgi:hypothetical protein